MNEELDHSTARGLRCIPIFGILLSIPYYRARIGQADDDDKAYVALMESMGGAPSRFPKAGGRQERLVIASEMLGNMIGVVLRDAGRKGEWCRDSADPFGDGALPDGRS